ncbi:cobyrinic acid a,c-diamide synthase [Pseudomonas fluorescens HK44]|uniref:Cobyrinic acid a,c-diamide synthase n=1 Tax=Pseudomonas fluorescens HK44 TaxID=1042209 RepID=A0A010TFJ9_PSEFL|nr:MinD/ParA family protein [Pseudomonas fluorescens]EXF95922.1 cobyrinic acid a,c-diamide synthase [Pseudomonas fluorescens HK44]
MSRMHPVQVIAVTGGKGGVGKTNVAVNLSLALAERGRQVMLLDADLGLANVDVLLGLVPPQNLANVIKGQCELRDVLLRGPRGISIVPASSGCQRMSHLMPAQHAGVIQAFSDVDEKIDVLVIDTASGIGDSVISFVRASREVLMVVCDEPTSLINTYALIKMLSDSYRINRFRILVNMTQTPQEGPELFARLVRVTNLFLDVSLQYIGAVPYDECMRKAVRKQRAVYDAFPRSQCSLAFKSIAKKIDAWPLPVSPRGHLEFFSERLLTSPMRRDTVRFVI